MEATERIGGSGDRTEYYITQLGNFDDQGLLQGEGTEYFGKQSCESIRDVAPYISGEITKSKIDLEKYTGVFQKGIKEGKGRAEEYRSGKLFKRYEGNFRKGLPHGKGTFELFGWGNNISYTVTPHVTQKYFGFFRQGFFHGPGHMVENNNPSYGMYSFGKLQKIELESSPKENESRQSVADPEKLRLRVSADEFKAYFDVDTLSNLTDTIEVGQRNKQGLLQGFGYRINDTGEYQVGYFSDGKLDGFGIQFRNLPEHKGLLASDYIEIIEIRKGKWDKGKIYEGEQMRYANKSLPGSSFPAGHAQSAGDGKLLEIYLETYTGKFDENELFTGWGKYTNDEQDKLITNTYGSLSRGYEYEYAGNFKQGKYHGAGDLKLKERGRITREISAVYDMGVERQIISKKTHRSFASLDYSTVVELNGTLGMIDKNEGLYKILLDGRRLRENDKHVVRHDLSSRIFYEICPVCRGEGVKWGSCSFTGSTVTGYSEHRQVITMGKNTYIEKSYTPKYRITTTEYPCPHKCSKCRGEKRLPITSPLPAEQFRKK